MNLSLKYGLPVAAVLIGSVVLVRLLIGVGPESPAVMIGPILYNLTAVAAIFLGTIRKKAEAGGELSFKDGVKTGLGIALVYATASSLFFVLLLLVDGPRLLLSEPGAENRPLWQTGLLAFVGLFLGSLFFGVIYSTVISFFLAKRRSQAQDL